MCLLSHCIAMDITFSSTIPAVKRHVTIYSVLDTNILIVHVFCLPPWYCIVLLWEWNTYQAMKLQQNQRQRHRKLERDLTLCLLLPNSCNESLLRSIIRFNLSFT
jgi:hypothetical protein